MKWTPMLLAIMALAGCAAPLRIRESYRARSYDAPAHAVPYAAEATPPLDSAPLEGLELADARSLARARNHTIAAAAAAVEDARAHIGEARAAFLPTLGGSINRTVNDETTTVSIPGGGSFSLSPEYVTRGSAQLTLSLFAFGRDKAALDAARADLDTEVLNERATHQELLFEVTTAWYRMHEARSQLQVARDSEVAAKRQLDDSTNIFDAGRFTKDQVLIARVNWLESRQTVLVANNAVLHSRRILNVLLARSPDAPLTISEPPPFKKVKVDAEKVLGLGHRHNPTLLAFRSTRRALELRRESTALSVAPEVTGTLGADYTNFREASGFSTNYTATLGVSMTPINGGRRVTQLQRIHAQLARLSAQEKQAHLDFEVNVRKTLLDLAETESQVELANEAVAAARESYRIISDRFRNGKTTSREVLDAQAQLSNSRNSYNLARFGHRVLLAQLETLLGVEQEHWLETQP